MHDGRALQPGTVVGGEWRIQRVLGEGGFGITYDALNRKANTRVALKEYLPVGYGSRASGSYEVRSAPGQDGDIFRWGRERFMKEAETLARFEHSSIVSVSGYFEANGTAYMALGYEDGGTLAAWLKALGRLPTQAELDRLIWPLADALTQVHSLFLLHRDIKPDNIMLRADLTPVLIDFGTAKAAIASQTRVVGAGVAVARSLIVASDGYSPPEQYASEGNLQGPWTDVYALAATLYRAIAGTSPPPAADRVVEDTYQPLTETKLVDGWRRDFLAAIDCALALKREQRPQSALEFRRALGLQATQRIADIPTQAPTDASPSDLPAFLAHGQSPTPPPANPRHSMKPAKPRAGKFPSNMMERTSWPARIAVISALLVVPTIAGSAWLSDRLGWRIGSLGGAILILLASTIALVWRGRRLTGTEIGCYLFVCSCAFIVAMIALLPAVLRY